MGMSNQIPSSRLVQPGVCTSTTRPASPFEGQAIFETDTDRMLIWNGTAWVVPNSTTANPMGLEYITSVSIGSGVTSVPISNCFSSSYDNYRIIVECRDSNASQQLRVQLDGITGNNYYTGGQFGSWGAASTSPYGPAVTSLWYCTANDVNGTPSNFILDFMNPSVARRKTGSIIAQSGNGYAFWNVLCTSTSVSTGFTLSKGGDTMTGGTISVYGYRK